MTSGTPDHPDVDAEIMTGLGRILGRLDPMPPVLDEMVLLALATADLDLELAQLVADDHRPVRGERSRELRFAAAMTTVLLSISPGDRGSVRLDGWLDPAQPATVTVQQAGRAARATGADKAGRFTIERLSAGTARLVIELRDGTRFGTPVVRL